MTNLVKEPTIHAPLLPGLDGDEQLSLAPAPVTTAAADEGSDTAPVVCEGQTTVYDMLTEPGA